MEVMKVKEKLKPVLKHEAGKGGLCDFCGTREAKHSINGNLWWLCRPCMDKAMMSTYECKNGMGEEE